MKNLKIVLGISFTLLFLFGCNSNKTLVINTIFSDGSVLRKVIVTSDSDGSFDPKDNHVPIDSSWNIERSMEVREGNDTLWTMVAEKLFPSVEEINDAYEADTGTNASMVRWATFEKKYRWFFTIYRFSENVEGILNIDLRIDDYMVPDEKAHFYLPNDVRESLENGPDSLEYRALSDSLESGHEDFIVACLVRQWFMDLHELCREQPGYDKDLEDLLSHEEYLIAFADLDFEGNFFPDSILREVLGGDFVESFSAEMDSAVNSLELPIEKYMDAEQYDLEIRMPGKVIESNGYLISQEDSLLNDGMQWTVSADYFFSGDYEMFVESRVRNLYAWIISGVFLLFVVTGLIWRRRRKMAAS